MGAAIAPGAIKVINHEDAIEMAIAEHFIALIPRKMAQSGGLV
jgi:hypothetical protein